MRLFIGNNPTQTFSVPNFEGDLWTVFEIEVNNNAVRVSQINTIDYTEGATFVQKSTETNTDAYLIKNNPKK